MQISFQRDELLRTLGYVTGVVERRQTLPILSYILLKQTGEEVSFTGTDLEIEVLAKGKARASGEFTATVPARKLFDICRALSADSTVDMKREGEKIVIKAGKSRFLLVTLPAGDFPNLDVGQWDLTLSFVQADLRRALEQTQFCMAQQDVRYYLNGLLFDIRPDTVRFVATDGHRMAMTELPRTSQVTSERQIVVPRKGVQEMIRLLDAPAEQAEIRISANHIQLCTPLLTFSSKLIDGRYPDYMKVLPTGQNRAATIERAPFRESLGRAAILSNEKYRGVRLSFQGPTLRITAHNPEQEEAQEEMPAGYNGEPLEIGFNVNYLLEATNALHGDTVQMGLSDANSSCLLTTPGTKYPQYVIMPMRL
jgi:DNA polymerase-3 subunit beta